MTYSRDSGRESLLLASMTPPHNSLREWHADDHAQAQNPAETITRIEGATCANQGTEKEMAAACSCGH
ncbi:hypothetical protein [Paraburkholderia susongensis]|uniref:hypothetical protein n=1 Tax=Paraburkholderia susongensis TaxID=1515439 RepID=UPI001ABF3AEE|nr:hypothetical protein [Paraburkholderia susongensis]